MPHLLKDKMAVSAYEAILELPGVREQSGKIQLAGTNGVTVIINEQSKLSFTHYVNRFRIEEAIRLLSDPNNETPLKAISTELGFNSISTFYNLFQSSVGMTPSQYRNKVMELQKEQ